MLEDNSQFIVRPKRIPPGTAPLCECGCGSSVEYNWRDGKWRRWAMGHSPKSSVAEIVEFYPPDRILGFARRAYQWPTISDVDRLMHSAFISCLYLGAFRINECLSLMKPMFKRMKSLENFDCLVIEAVIVEKSGGKKRNCPIYVKDPLAVPLLKYLETLPDTAKVFDMTDRTGNNIADRVSEGIAWNHWFREQRVNWLANVFSRDERKKIVGWGSESRTKEQRMKQREMADRYEFMNWMAYADRLAKWTDRYWENATIDADTAWWLAQLKLMRDPHLLAEEKKE